MAGAADKKKASKDAANPNMWLWNQIFTTDPSMTKDVPKGGRKITAIDTYSRIKRATELFGPLGQGWGWELIETDYAKDTYIVWLKLWWVTPEHPKDGTADFLEAERTKRHEWCCCGSASMVIKMRNGDIKVDDEAPKKAMTDAITKGLSYLGMNADVFMGLFDNSKYVEHAAQETREGSHAAPAGGSRPERREPVAPPPSIESPNDLVHWDESMKEQCSLAVDADGFPKWFHYKVGFGENAEKKWGYIASGSDGGRRQQWCEYIIGQFDPNKNRNSCLSWLRAKGALKWAENPDRPKWVEEQ